MEILTDDLRALGDRVGRRAFLGRARTGLGALALASLLDPKRLFGSAGTPDAWPGVVTPR